MDDIHGSYAFFIFSTKETVWVGGLIKRLVFFIEYKHSTPS